MLTCPVRGSLALLTIPASPLPATLTCRPYPSQSSRFQLIMLRYIHADPRCWLKRPSHGHGEVLQLCAASVLHSQHSLAPPINRAHSQMP